ncbi:MAG: family 3 adenylate cyclase [Acidobacteria bacterium]|nr:family 3 adenylate cyclase [Acidobacteriota bacterium]
MPIPFTLDYVIHRLAADARSQRQTIKKLTGISLKRDEATAVWPRILEHKWFISERLGRDTGLKVAAIDYFENVYRGPVSWQRSDSLPPRLRMFAPLMKTMGAH